MLGAHSGVVARLKELVMTHCAAHRLSLPAFDTAHKFPWFSKFENTLNQLYTHFSRSSVCSATLEAVQKVLDAPQLKGIFPHRQFPLCQFPLHQFPFGQLPTSSIPTLSIPIWSMLTKWELTKWELTKWELTKWEVDKVGKFTIVTVYTSNF